jgi:hypothetical protein
MSFVCIALATSHADVRSGWSDLAFNVSWHWIEVDRGLILEFLVKKLNFFRCINGLYIFRIVYSVTCADSVAVPSFEASSRTRCFCSIDQVIRFPVDRCVLRLCVLWRQWETQSCGPSCDHKAEENVFCSFPYIMMCVTFMHQAPPSVCVLISNF